MRALDAMRRRFITHFASIGLGTTLAPGIIWPFGEMELLALAKAYQDAAGFHVKRPTALDT